MNILITHFYSRHNNGDAAILHGQLTELKAALPKAQLTVATMDDVNQYPAFEGTPQVPALFLTALDPRRSSLLNMLHVVRSFVGGWLWAGTYRLFGWGFAGLMIPSERQFLRALAAADIVVPVGGGYFRTGKAGVTGAVDLWLILQPFYLAQQLKKPIVLYSQSIGPFHGHWQERRVQRVLNSCRQINLRENKSLALLKCMGVSQSRMQRTADAAFLITNKELKPKLPTTLLDQLSALRRPLVGVTARSWLSKEGQAAYEHQMALAIDAIIEQHNVSVILVPQVTFDDLGDDDRTVQSRIYAQLKHQDKVLNLLDSLDFRELKALYGQLDYLIGTRFHSVIFALTEHVPAIAVEYEHKTSGIMNDLGLGDWVISMEQLSSEKIVELFSGVFADRTGYVAHLESVLPAYTEKAHKANDLIVDLAKE